MNIKTFRRVDFIDITDEVENLVKKSGVIEGTCLLFVPHTTAGITINENSDPAVRNDIRLKINKMIPQDEEYSHNEGNSDAHIKSSLFGTSISLIICNGKLAIGTWQGIYFCEFDGPKNRNLYIKFIAG
jgi:secondary thiamine-phosphate synthase enzyme